MLRPCCGLCARRTREDYHVNLMLQDALVRNIEVVGEAVKNLSLEITHAHPKIAWSQIARMRDKIAHHYFRVNLDVVWKTATHDLPPFGLISRRSMKVSRNNQLDQRFGSPLKHYSLFTINYSLISAVKKELLGFWRSNPPSQFSLKTFRLPPTVSRPNDVRISTEK